MNLGQKHNETLNVFIANNTNGNYLIILYKIANTINILLSNNLHYDVYFVILLFTIILPIKFNIFVNKKHNEHIIVDAGPNWRTGNCYKLSYIRIIVTVVIEDCEIRQNIYGKYV